MNISFDAEDAYSTGDESNKGLGFQGPHSTLVISQPQNYGSSLRKAYLYMYLSINRYLAYIRQREEFGIDERIMFRNHSLPAEDQPLRTFLKYHFVQKRGIMPWTLPYTIGTKISQTRTRSLKLRDQRVASLVTRYASRRI